MEDKSDKELLDSEVSDDVEESDAEESGKSWFEKLNIDPNRVIRKEGIVYPPRHARTSSLDVGKSVGDRIREAKGSVGSRVKRSKEGVKRKISGVLRNASERIENLAEKIGGKESASHTVEDSSKVPAEVKPPAKKPPKKPPAEPTVKEEKELLSPEEVKKLRNEITSIYKEIEKWSNKKAEWEALLTDYFAVFDGIKNTVHEVVIDGKVIKKPSKQSSLEEQVPYFVYQEFERVKKEFKELLDSIYDDVKKQRYQDALEKVEKLFEHYPLEYSGGDSKVDEIRVATRILLLEMSSSLKELSSASDESDKKEIKTKLTADQIVFSDFMSKLYLDKDGLCKIIEEKVRNKYKEEKDKSTGLRIKNRLVDVALNSSYEDFEKEVMKSPINDIDVKGKLAKVKKVMQQIDALKEKEQEGIDVSERIERKRRQLIALIMVLKTESYETILRKNIEDAERHIEVLEGKRRAILPKLHEYQRQKKNNKHRKSAVDLDKKGKEPGKKLAMDKPSKDKDHTPKLPTPADVEKPKTKKGKARKFGKDDAVQIATEFGKLLRAKEKVFKMFSNKKLRKLRMRAQLQAMRRGVSIRDAVEDVVNDYFSSMYTRWFREKVNPHLRDDVRVLLLEDEITSDFAELFDSIKHDVNRTREVMEIVYNQVNPGTRFRERFRRFLRTKAGVGLRLGVGAALFLSSALSGVGALAAASLTWSSLWRYIGVTGIYDVALTTFAGRRISDADYQKAYRTGVHLLMQRESVVSDEGVKDLASLEGNIVADGMVHGARNMKKHRIARTLLGVVALAAPFIAKSIENIFFKGGSQPPVGTVDGGITPDSTPPIDSVQPTPPTPDTGLTIPDTFTYTINNGEHVWKASHEIAKQVLSYYDNLDMNTLQSIYVDNDTTLATVVTDFFKDISQYSHGVGDQVLPGTKVVLKKAEMLQKLSDWGILNIDSTLNDNVKQFMKALLEGKKEEAGVMLDYIRKTVAKTGGRVLGTVTH